MISDKMKPTSNKLPTNANSFRGIVFSIDSLFSLIIVFFTVSVIINSILLDFSPQSMQLQRQGMDFLTTLEVLDTFPDDPINKETVDKVFNSTSSSTCARLDIFSVQTSLVSAGISTPTDSVLKPGCPYSSDQEQVIWRTWTHDAQMQFVRLHIWSRGIN